METSVILDLTFSMKSQIQIFETGIEEGIFSRNKKFYNNIENQEKINEIFFNTRQEIGQKFGFKGEKVFQSTQKTSQNNEKYLAEQKVSLLKKPDATYLANLTELIVDVISINKAMK